MVGNVDHHEWFRRLVRDHVEHNRHWQDARLRGDWILECYHSRDAFENRFPDPVKRRDLLEELDSRHDSRKESIELLKRMEKPSRER